MEMWCPDDVGRIAGIGLGHLLGKSMIQLDRVGWRLLACLYGASPDCIVLLLDPTQTTIRILRDAWV